MTADYDHVQVQRADGSVGPTVQDCLAKCLQERDDLRVHVRAALAALTQPATFPADVALARSLLGDALIEASNRRTFRTLITGAAPAHVGPMPCGCQHADSVACAQARYGTRRHACACGCHTEDDPDDYEEIR